MSGRGDRLGVDETLISAYGELVFNLSHNVQQRTGDPVRRLDFAGVEAMRDGMGLTDAQIAERLGLTTPQVIWIRNVVERRKIDRHAYRRLHGLGGGRRYRADSYVDAADAPPLSAAATALRAALAFDPGQVRRFVAEGWWHGDTLRGWLERNAAATPDGIAIDGTGEALTWRELLDRVRALATGLRRLGIGRGEVVAVQLPNVPEYLVSYLAISAIGAVMTTIYLPYRGREIEALLRHSRAVACICPAAIGDFSPASLLLPLRAALPEFEHVVVLGPAVDGTTPFAELAATPAEPLPDGIPVGADPFLLLYTSGTTASPKGVPHPYQTMLSNARLGVAEHRFTPADRVLSAAPYGHLFGLYSFHLALAAGATTLLLPVFSPPALAKALVAMRPTALFTAPAHLLACLGMGLLGGGEPASLRLAVLSGSAVPAELARRFDALMPEGRVTQLWGMTETQAALYTRPDDPVEVAAAGAGRPSPGTEVRVVGDDDAELPDGEEGELQVRGCLLFPGYYDNPAANADAFTAGGWFRTGDLAVRASDGNVALTGRIKDVINRGGVKINPRDIEDLLDLHPDVMQSAIVAMPDPVLGEKACAFVVPAAGATVTLERLCSYLLEKEVAKLRLPERLVVVDSMPMTATRKVIKGRLVIPE